MVDIWISLHLDGAKNKPTKPVLRGPNIWTIPWWHYFFGVITFKQQKPSTACSFDRNQQQTSGRLDAWAKHWSECWSIIISRFFNGNCLALSGSLAAEPTGASLFFIITPIPGDTPWWITVLQHPHHLAELHLVHAPRIVHLDVRSVMRQSCRFYGGMPSNMVVSANGGTPKLMVYEGKPY